MPRYPQQDRTGRIIILIMIVLFLFFGILPVILPFLTVLLIVWLILKAKRDDLSAQTRHTSDNIEHFVRSSSKSAVNKMKDFSQTRSSHTKAGTPPPFSFNPQEGRQKSSQNSRPQNQPSIHPYYQEALHRLEHDATLLSNRKQAVYPFLNDIFSGSEITINRYKEVIESAQDTLEKNHQKARQAIQLFDVSAAPSLERKQIIDNYVQNSSDIIQCFERVVDELIKIQQSKTFEEGDLLDERLNELANTTKYYKQGIR